VSGPVVLLTGGTGGAKLARGLAEVTDDLVAVVNTGDDVEAYGAHVSPDPDLVSFWLADRIDARGWGLDGDTFHVMDGLRELGDDVWFNLGDRDLALCVRRARRLAEGATPAHAREVLDAETRRVERVLLEVRLRSGLPLEALDEAGRAALPGLVADGLVEGWHDRVVLTLRGRLLADGVVHRLLG